MVDQFPADNRPYLVARLRDPKLASGASDGIHCGIQAKLESGCDDGEEVDKEVDALIAKYDPPAPSPFGNLLGDLDGGMVSPLLGSGSNLIRVAALQNPSGGRYNVL